jgi:hypothetical protein
MPREGHFKAVLHVMGYLKAHSNSHLIFDPEKPNVSNCGFKEYSSSDWGTEYDGAEELIPVDAPKALGKSVLLRMFVDSDHAGDKKSRCSRTGFVILVNGGIIDWLSEKQSTIETLVFGAEFCALKHSIENLRSIRYKLRMMGVPIDGATRIFGDNMSVVTNQASLSQRSRRSLILFATMQYVRLLSWAKPLLPTLVPLITLLIFSPRHCMVRHATSWWADSCMICFRTWPKLRPIRLE